MKKIFIFFLFAGFVFFLQNKVNAQSQAEIIKVKGKGGGYYQNDVKLNNKMIRDIISSNPEAAKHIKKANNNSVVAKALFATAMALIIIPPIVNVVSEKTDLAVNTQTFPFGLLGGGFLLTAIPFAFSAGGHKKKAISIYNSGLTSFESVKINIELGLTQNGIGLRFIF